MSEDNKLSFCFQMNKIQIKRSTRFYNFLIDSIIFIVLALIIVPLIVRYVPAFRVYNVQNNRILAFSIYFLYYFLFEVTLSSTPGKLLTKTRVVDKFTFSKSSVFKVFIRTLCRFIPLEALTIFFDENNLTWHDKISKTTVINYIT